MPAAQNVRLKRVLSFGSLFCLTISLVGTFTSALPTISNDGWLNLTVIHTNDVHSRVDPANLVGVSCSTQDIASGNCYGGSARHKTVIEGLRKSSQHSLLLDGGDEFQGTLFYTFYKGTVTAEVMNELGYDLGTIGNHEWDDGPENLGRYWPRLKFPIVCANVDFSKNPSLAKWVKPYHIFEDIGVAVIGYITNTTGDISNAGPTVSFTDPIPVVQKYIDELEAKGIKRIFGLSHNGYGPDMELAANTHGLDLIVGGHSHSYLGDPKNPNYEGPYPTVIKNLKGENTLIVQAFCWGRYIGHLDVVFNPEGKIVSWEGAPILVENTVQPDSRLLGRIDGWRKEFQDWGATILGVATDEFDQASCKQRECSMGNLVADAMLDLARTPILNLPKDRIPDLSFAEANGEIRTINDGRPWTDLAFINSGGIRSGLPAGNVTIEMIMTTSPFGNKLVQTQMTGNEILEMLEAVSTGHHEHSQKHVTSNIQISGLRYIFDSSRKYPESMLVKAEVKGYDGVWRKIDKRKIYWITTLDFVLNGGDNILEPRKIQIEIPLEVLDLVLMDYIEARGRITPYLDGRIKNINPKLETSSDRRFNIPVYWPSSTPEHVKNRYPGGVEEMLEDYTRLRGGNPVVPEIDISVEEDHETRQDIWI